MQLAGALHLPCLSKDAVKEVIFDELGWSDRAWSVRVGTAAIAIMLDLAERFLQAGSPCLVESNFRPAHAGPDFLALQARTPFNPVQVLCSCDGPTLVERFAARSLSQDRHPGHVDAGNLEEFVPELLVGSYEPLPLAGPVFRLDNTRFDADAWQCLIERSDRRWLRILGSTQLFASDRLEIWQVTDDRGPDRFEAKLGVSVGQYVAEVADLTPRDLRVPVLQSV
jgi:hypothetical protein